MRSSGEDLLVARLSGASPAGVEMLDCWFAGAFKLKLLMTLVLVANAVSGGTEHEISRGGNQYLFWLWNQLSGDLGTALTQVE